MPPSHKKVLLKKIQFLTGPVEFQMFGQNKEVQRVFHACVKEGLSKSNGTLEEQAEQMMEHSEEGRYEKKATPVLNSNLDDVMDKKIGIQDCNIQ